MEGSRLVNDGDQSVSVSAWPPSSPPPWWRARRPFSVIRAIINLRGAAHHSEAQVLQTADRITDVILRSTHYEMLHNDREALYNIVQEIGSEPGIRRIRIFNKEGRIRFPPKGRSARRWKSAPRHATAATRSSSRW